jgi:hypothetical protein
VEEHDTREAPDRRIRRILEAENKKKRDAAKKERNEEIRVGNLSYFSQIFFFYGYFQYITVLKFSFMSLTFR